jgi:release factor glutamine methyltransferase
LTFRQVLDHARRRLSGLKDVEDPGLESEVLLRHILHFSRAQLYLDLNVQLNPDQESIFNQWVELRLRGEPLAYIIKSREFYGLDFFVDGRVLIPRPETELLVEETIRFCDRRPAVVLADIGTGSGAIAVSLAFHLLQVKIYAIDISAQALEVARFNAHRQGVTDRVTLLQGDLLEPLKHPVDAIIANLPYVGTAEWQTMPSAAFEPRQALDGGEKGLYQIFRLIDQLKGKVNPGGWVLLEIDMGQAEAVTGYLKKLYPDRTIETLKDLAGIKRVVKLII